MTEVKVGPRSKELAIKLLAAAEVKGHEPFVVKTVGGGYIVPQEVADEAEVEYDDYSEAATTGEADAAGAAEEPTTEKKKPAAKAKAATKKE